MAKATPRTEPGEFYLVPDAAFDEVLAEHKRELERLRADRPLTFGRIDAVNDASTMERRLSMQFDRQHARRFNVFKPSAFGELV